MTKKIKDLAVKVGTYQKGGETKSKYVNIGCILEKDDGGKFMLLERTFNPAGVPNPEGKETLLVSIFDVKGSEEKPDTHKGYDKTGNGPSTQDMSDEVPF